MKYFFLIISVIVTIILMTITLTFGKNHILESAQIALFLIILVIVTILTEEKRHE